MQQQFNVNFVQKNNFSVRPSASNGLWVSFLLPISLITSLLKHSITATPTYKLATLISVALFCNSVYVVVKVFKNDKVKIFNVWSVFFAVFTASLIDFNLAKGWIFSLLSSTICTFLHLKIFKSLLSKLPESFTLGEANLVSQGITLFLYCAFVNIVGYDAKNFRSNLQICTAIIQVGLLGIMCLALTMNQLNIKTTKKFYLVTAILLTITIIIPLHILLNMSPVLWIFTQIFQNTVLLKLFTYWSFCIAVAVLAISNQIYYAKKASTTTRKIFHVLSVLVYVPGLYFQCSFLYMASGVILGMFFALEILRLLSIPPLGTQLQDGYFVFKDEKDAGVLALTPIYLLTGISLPLWIHPSPCDMTDSAQFCILPLLSGILSIGIGDTAASYIGSNYGRFKWKNSSKTLEGTLACVLSQLGFLYFLFSLGFLPFIDSQHVIKVVISVVLGSLIEAKTSQIDNLVLPLVMYIILI